MTPPIGYKGHPAWEAFELWAEANGVGDTAEDYGIFWECFLTGFEIGQAEAA